MGEAKSNRLDPDYNRAVKVEFVVDQIDGDKVNQFTTIGIDLGASRSPGTLVVAIGYAVAFGIQRIAIHVHR